VHAAAVAGSTPQRNGACFFRGSRCAGSPRGYRAVAGTRHRISSPMRAARYLLAALVGAYCLYCGALFSYQRVLFYPGARISVPSAPPTGAAGLQRYWLPVSGGPVEAWYLPPLQPVGQARVPAVIFAHGNGEVIDQWVVGLDGFRSLGMAVLLVEYQGYGRSAGHPGEESIRDAMVAGFDVLRSSPAVDPRRIVAYGQSLGGGAVCELIRRRPVAAVILQSTFSTTRIFARRYLAPALLVRDPFENLEAVREYPGPVLVIHGTSDGLIPFAEGAALAAAARNGRLLAYDCGHWCWYPDRLPFWRDATQFLRQAGIIPPGERHREGGTT
jgi:uncharacterized protein